MFRRLFRIGFGGCGCALEEHFRNHAVELARELLLKCYVEKLKKWDDMLSLDKFEMTNVGELKSNLKEAKFNDETFNDQLKEIKNELDSWDKSLDRARKSTGMSYEEDIIIELRSIITEMGNEVKKIKNKGSILLESLPVDTYSGSEETDKRIYLYNQDIIETRDLIVDQYEHAVIESEGFNHQPELQMLPFSIHEVRNEVYSNLKKKILKDKLLKKASRGYLFFVGLGGGTGTGVISPLAERFGKGSQGYFTLGVLGGKNDGDYLSESQKPWFRRCFNMLLALNDLMVTADLDGIILLDNEVVIKRLEDRGTKVNAKEIDNEIIRVLYPAFGVTALENKENKLDWAQLRGPIGLNVLKRKPPVFVPCYASGDGNLEDLIGDALTNGMLANYKYKSDNGDRPVEKVFVYTRCIEDEDAVEKKLRELFGKKEDIAIIKEYLFCWDDIAKENYKEFRRFVGDYYDITWANAATPSPDKRVNTLKISKNPDEYIKIETDYLFNWDSVLKGENKEELKSYLREGLKIEWADRLNPKISKDKKTISIVKDNENKVEITLDDDDKKATLRSEGESLGLQVKRKKGNRIIYQPSNAKLIYSKNKDNPTDLDVKTVNDKDYIYLKGGPATRDWLLRKLENKTVVVFESQEIGTYWKVRALIEKSKEERKECEVNHEIIRNFKKNEVLILLVNPNIKDALYDRLQEANKFVGLLDKFKKLIDENEAGSTGKSGIADDIVNGSIHDTEIDTILNDISTVGINKTTKEAQKEILAEAKAFLLPNELIEKNENIYEHMKKILEKRLKNEADNACKSLKEGKWPIFKGKIFDITSISGKRDEVILSSISAMNAKDEFKRLVGDAYDTYTKSFQRQFFKYHTHYLYPGSGADYILSDDSEYFYLPVELKNKINEEAEPIKGDDLENLVKEHRDNPVILDFSSDNMNLEQLENGVVSKEELVNEFEKNKITLSENAVCV